MAKFVLMALVMTGAWAQARPTSYQMTCDEARSLVQENGAIVMNYGYSEKAGWLYNRYVAHRGYCNPGEVIQAAWAPTMDQDHCRVGYVCIHHSHH